MQRRAQCVDSCTRGSLATLDTTTATVRARLTLRRLRTKQLTYCPTKCSLRFDGAMAAYGPITCSPEAPPSQLLPPGPACSQAASRAFKFCNTSLSLEARVADLVNRVSVAEAGALLTARESPAIRLGIPAFYWGTNALHGVQWGNATSFPQTISLASTWNRSVWRGVGRVVGREMRALHNVGTPNVKAGAR